MARSRNVSSNTVVRDRPPSLASYMAESASRRSVSLVSLIGGVGDADARREEQLVAVDGDRSFEHGVDPCREHVGVDAGRFAVQEDELVPAEAGDELVGERGGQPLRGGTEHLVTGLMPDPVVDDLEPVEVDEQDDDRVAVQLAALQVARRAG